MNNLKKAVLALLIVSALSACKSKEERAEAYYQSALTLLEAGDVDRSLLELRNVFDNDGRHLEARRLYADLTLAQGDVSVAYGQYLRLVEQYPNEVEVRRLLAEIALDLGDYEEVKRHGAAAIELAPEVVEHKALSLFINYQEARLANNDVSAGEIVVKVEELLHRSPDLTTGLRILTDWYATSPAPLRAMPYVNRLIELFPNSQSLHMIRLGLLQEDGQTHEVSEKLREMYQRFPDDEVVVHHLIQWYNSQKDFQTLLAFLREKAGPLDSAIENHLPIVELLMQMDGQEEGIVELKKLAKANEGTDLGRRYQLQISSLRFGAERPDEIIASVEEIISNAEHVDLKNEARLQLSRMRYSTGRNEEARQLIEQVLQEDPSNVDGLIALAAWQVRDDEFSKAISNLRQALGQEPRNSETLLLLAEAQQKMGNIELAEQRLAKAVEVTNSAPREALLYGRFQLARNNLPAADQVLTEAFRRTGDLEVARLLGQVLLRRGDFEGAQGVLDLLAKSESPSAAPLARSLQAALLFNQNRIEEGFAFLRSGIDEGDPTGELVTALQILRVQMVSGRLAEARTQIESMLERFHDNTALQLLEANLSALEGKPEEAVTAYRRIHAQEPRNITVIRRYHSALLDIGNNEGARGLLAVAYGEQPNDPDLMMMKAEEFQKDSDPESAIEIYEALYELNPNNLIVVNNLVGLFSSYRSAETDLKRAHKIAQRLNGANVPEMLDTLGWIQLLNGETDRAILSFQAATRGLPANATIAFNLAHAFAKADRKEDALRELRRGFNLAGGDESVPHFFRAKSLLEELSG